VADVEKPGIFERLKRRSVFRVGAMYVVAAWVLLQVADVLADPFSFPDWFQTTLIGALIIGFPIALVLAWVFDVTPDGVVRSTEDSRLELVRLRRGHKIDYAIIGTLVIALGLSYLREPEPVVQATEQVVDDNSPKGSAEQEVQEPDQAPSIAVLPFANMSDDPKQEYFSDGIAEDILNALVRNTGMKVVARTSSFQFKGKNQDVREIGTKLNVTHILEGSVRKSGNRIRVTAQLNSTVDGKHIWSDQYDRELTDIFEVQDEITQHIVNALNTKLLGSVYRSQSKANIEAYNLYLLGQFHLGRLEIEQAIEYHKQAMALDPNYIAVYNSLIFDTLLSIGLGLKEPEEAHTEARRLIMAALQLNSNDAVTLSWQAYVYQWVDFESQEAINQFDLLVRESPTGNTLLLYGRSLALLGQYDAAVLTLKEGLKHDPLSPLLYINLGHVLLIQGQYQAALDAFRRVETFGLKVPHLIAWVHLAKGNRAGIQMQLKRSKEIWEPGYFDFYTAIEAYLRGDSDQTNKALEPINELSGGLHLPLKFRAALLGDNLKLAVNYFTQGMQWSLINMSQDVRPVPVSFMQAFYENPEYQGILSEFRLDKPSVAKLNFPPLPF
jgi:TolB-like protein